MPFLMAYMFLMKKETQNNFHICVFFQIKLWN